MLRSIYKAEVSGTTDCGGGTTNMRLIKKFEFM